jgi:hypothetical protein
VKLIYHAIKLSVMILCMFILQHAVPAMASDTALLFRPDEDPFDIGWGEIMYSGKVEAAFRPESPVEFEVVAERTNVLSRELQADPELARIAVKRAIEKPAPFDQGVYGKIGKSTIYVAPARRVKSTSRLYWTMVKVLSEKYGCFIVDKKREGEHFQFQCRDGRHVKMKRKVHGSEIAFWGRQYHANGDEVDVKASKTGRTAFLEMFSKRLRR